MHQIEGGAIAEREIGNKHINLLGFEDITGLRPRRRRDHRIAFALEKRFEHESMIDVIVDNEDERRAS